MIHHFLLMVDDKNQETTFFDGCIPGAEAIERIQSWLDDSESEHSVEENHHGPVGSD